ncbi:MAG: MEKHLA domain-containing protein [Gammaproteobacteria bacterium]|nr:MEKHLA domain-containing protein [Gammaproteobacteria bacterium]MDP2140648.1 MEKHLA domain-containing protein [Gammaproteobacteria bacterium]MDP2347420.1 MEKHLA domain-containing protein [Gammaproteobacteria bacterium]
MTGNIEKIALIAASFERLTGNRLVDSVDDVIAAMWDAPRVILAHGTETDPVFFYGNKMALNLFEISHEELQCMPSRLSAETLDQDARKRSLEQVSRDGFTAGYSGVRVSSTGKRFRIEQAVVWNLLDEEGRMHGQAATFDRWSPLP